MGGAGGYRKCEGRNILGSFPSSSSPTADWRFHLVLRKKWCTVTMEAETAGIVSNNQSLTASNCSFVVNQLLMMLNY